MPSGIEAALFTRLIDHAPLFPPASLPLAEALEEHRASVSGDQGWIVRRFVCPASMLAELDGEPLSSRSCSTRRLTSKIVGSRRSRCRPIAAS